MLGTCWHTFNKTSVENHHPETFGRVFVSQRHSGSTSLPKAPGEKHFATVFLKSSSRTMEVTVNLWAMLLVAGSDLGVFANLTWACQSSLRPQPLVRWSLQLSLHPRLWDLSILPWMVLQVLMDHTIAKHSEGIGLYFNHPRTKDCCRAVSSCV